MKNEKNTIKSPEEVSKLMEDLWLNHKARNKAFQNNVFWVELPPLSEEEKMKDIDDNPEDLYGVWI